MNYRGGMIAGIVQNKNTGPTSIFMSQLGQESQKLHRIFAETNFIRDFVRSIVQRPVDGDFLILAGSGDPDALALGHPHTDQMGMQMNFAFIEEQKFYVGTGFQGLFFA